VAGCVVVGLGSIVTLAGMATGTLFFSWLAPVGLAASVLMGTAAFREAAYWSSIRRRFLAELLTAQAELAVLGDAETREAWSRKWFIRVLRREREIKATHARRMHEIDWIQFLEKYAAAGGAVILEWYGAELSLLKTAKHYDSTLTFAEFEQAKLLDNLHLAGMQRTGEEQIDLDVEKMRREIEPPTPWEDTL
jgi:hypothetical protein